MGKGETKQVMRSKCRRRGNCSVKQEAQVVQQKLIANLIGEVNFHQFVHQIAHFLQLPMMGRQQQRLHQFL